MLKRFWTCWRREYLVNLREAHQVRERKRRNESPHSPQKGDIVLIRDQLPRSRWKLGKIMNLIEGRDGIVRGATVKSENSTINRAITHLYPLEINDNVAGEDVVTQEQNGV